ncbi:MAG: HlyD family type I secretion periplasmic adaptor subunit [Gammaproteobacteria bacterium]|nr:HlyD family type I secretion periplasmic adaptor subunit [Gammaproteobacteria bacterium]
MNSRPLELQFLPAALEIEETPPLPLARAMVWAIVAFLALALVWSYVGRVDIVGVAPGKLVPTGRTKTIQPLERSVVKSILITEGQHVNAGDVLIELDPSTPAADKARLDQERQALTLDHARLTRLLDTIRGHRVGTDLTSVPTQDRFAQQLAEYRAAISGIEEDRRQKRAEREAVNARLTQLDATLPLITEEAEAHQKLTVTGIVPRVKWLAVERERIGIQQELAAQREQRKVLDATLDSLNERRKVTDAQYQSRWMAELTDTETKLATYHEELAKAERRLALTTLTAPVSGTVQQLAVHTEGGVVTEAQPLLVLVPDDSPLEVEAMVPNKDIGFVYEGQAAIVKIETFNFTKYGYLTGKVSKVSHDAVADKEQGLIYPAHIALDATTIKVDGQPVHLSPGMAVTAELKLGQRRVIEFLLSPLLRYSQESGRER